MTDPATINVRTARPEDAEGVAAALGADDPVAKLASAVSAKQHVVLATAPDGTVLGAAALCFDGLPQDAETPELVGPSVAADHDGVRAAILERVEADARAAGKTSIGMVCEATDREAAKRAEALGFRTAARGPYRPLGPGLVEHLHGYTDPVGFQVDLVKSL